jgi:riboflavin kinase/FMN adenylyltransferase
MKAAYTIIGKVKNGAKRGKSLGFPTANVSLHKKIPEGVYISQVKIHKRIYPAATFIGSAMTFGEKDYKSECHILDFHDDLYGIWISIMLYKKIRGNLKFGSKEGLIKQMEQDISIVRSWFHNRI